MLLVWLSIYSNVYGVEVDPTKEVDAEIESLVSSDEPGMQYIIVDRENVVFSRSTGLADIESKTPLSLSHTMVANSMTKTLTAIAVLQLVEKEKLKLSSKVSTYISHPYDQNITISHLLNHTSGIPNPIPLRWAHLATAHNGFDENKALSTALSENSQADFLPGEEYGYSNIGYWLLGFVIEEVSGQDYSSYVNANIFDALNLSRDEIGFEIFDKFMHSKGYLNKYSFMNLIKPFLLDESILGDYEGAWLRIRDVYLNGPAFGGSIGSSTAFSIILQDILKENSVLLGDNVKSYLYLQQKLNSDHLIDMTLGWHIGELNDAKYYYKEGGGAGPCK